MGKSHTKVGVDHGSSEDDGDQPPSVHKLRAGRISIVKGISAEEAHRLARLQLDGESVLRYPTLPKPLGDAPLFRDVAYEPHLPSSLVVNTREPLPKLPTSPSTSPVPRSPHQERSHGHVSGGVLYIKNFWKLVLLVCMVVLGFHDHLLSSFPHDWIPALSMPQFRSSYTSELPDTWKADRASAYLTQLGKINLTTLDDGVVRLLGYTNTSINNIPSAEHRTATYFLSCVIPQVEKASYHLLTLKTLQTLHETLEEFVRRCNVAVTYVADAERHINATIQAVDGVKAAYVSSSSSAIASYEDPRNGILFRPDVSTHEARQKELDTRLVDMVASRLLLDKEAKRWQAGGQKAKELLPMVKKWIEAVPPAGSYRVVGSDKAIVLDRICDIVSSLPGSLVSTLCN